MADPRPSLIRCKTIIGYGAPHKQGTAATHGAALGKDEVEAARVELDWNSPGVRDPRRRAHAWRAVGQARRGRPCAVESGSRPVARRTSSSRGSTGKADDAWLKPYLDSLLADLKPVATRKASEMALEAINPAIPATIGGSADLTGSNNTKTKGLEPLTADNYGGRYIYYGIREFGMAAAMNGMALHGGVIPYGGTFLVFTDYARPGDPPLRAAAGEGHLRDDPRFDRAWRGRADAPADRASASLRAMPQLRSIRPADAVETAECWALALASEGPSILR